MSESGTIDAGLIRIDRGRDTQPPQPTAPSAAHDDASRPAEAGNLPMSERDRVIAALDQAGWVQAKAARLLGMTPRQIAYRIQILGIEVKQF